MSEDRTVVNLFRAPEYRRLRAQLPVDLVGKLEQFVEFVKTQGEWEKEHATTDNVLEYIIEEMLNSTSREMVAFRKEEKNTDGSS
jgi:hypothetical protein